jgi:hypothetical protein
MPGKNSENSTAIQNSAEKVKYINTGTQKKKKLVTHRGTAVQDKKISTLAKKSRKI